MVCFSLPLHGCTQFGWQNTWESDSWRPRHPKPSTTNSCWPSRAEKWALTSNRTECEKGSKNAGENPTPQIVMTLSMNEAEEPRLSNRDSRNPDAARSQQRRSPPNSFLHCLDHPQHLSFALPPALGPCGCGLTVEFFHRPPRGGRGGRGSA